MFFLNNMALASLLDTHTFIYTYIYTYQGLRPLPPPPVNKGKGKGKGRGKGGEAGPPPRAPLPSTIPPRPSHGHTSHRTATFGAGSLAPNGAGIYHRALECRLLGICSGSRAL